MYWVLGAIYYFFEAFLGFSLQSVLFGSLKAVVFGVQWLVLARLWRWMQVRYVGTVKFYLNIAIKNKEEAVKTKSMEKSRIAGKLIGHTAAQRFLVHPEERWPQCLSKLSLMNNFSGPLQPHASFEVTEALFLTCCSQGASPLVGFVGS